MTTPTPSLRRRVTLTVLSLFTLILVLVGVLVDVALGAQLRHDLTLRLADRVQAAQRLADGGTSAEQLVPLLQGQDIRVRVEVPDGRGYGDPGLDPNPPGPPPAAGDGAARARPAGAPGPPSPPEATSTTVTRTLPDGSRLVLVADTTSITEVQNRLRWIMVLAASAALAVAALAVGLGVGRALRPLGRLTGLAQRITAGDRGPRLDPDRPRSELGRAATAFDTMLDALEDAESRARRSAEETRGFLADAAHELRTPLAGMQVLAERIAAAPGDERQQRRAGLLVRETGRAARLVADMLDLARLDEGALPLEPADVDLAALAAAEVERVRVLAPGTTITLDAAAPSAVRADPGRVTQILTNLLDNARRHTPTDGTITVTVSGGTVAVDNTGPEIAEPDRERIFGRLVRLQEARDRDSGGAGLGLALARGVARAHGGDLAATPRTGGARFVLTLPRTRTDAQQ